MPATWTTPASWTSGAVLTAAKMITEVTDHLDWIGSSKPMCRLTNSGNQSIPNAVDTAILFNSEPVKTVASMHSTITDTHLLVIPVAGIYAVGCGLTMASSGPNGHVRIALNTTEWVARVSMRTENYVAFSTIYDFAATDTLEVIVAQDSGGAANSIVEADASPILWAYWIGD